MDCNRMNPIDRRRLCDHAGTGDGPCTHCGATPQRKWLDLANEWIATAIAASARAEECADLACDAALAEQARLARATLTSRRKHLRETCILIDGFGYYAERDRIDKARNRREVLRVVREGLDETFTGTMGARCK